MEVEKKLHNAQLYSAGEIWGYFDKHYERITTFLNPPIIKLYRAGFGDIEVGGISDGSYMHIDAYPFPGTNCVIGSACIFEGALGHRSNYIVFDCDTGKGDSGGPLVNYDTGALVGVNTGYATKINTVGTKIDGNIGVYMAKIIRDNDRNGNGRIDEGDF